MPVFMVKADTKALKEQPSWQVDLNKIYSEGTCEDAEAFINQALAKPNSWFAGALFNDHLLGSVLVTQEENKWQLSYLSVRKVTRRRGVAKRLLDLLIEQAAEQKVSLYFSDLQDNEAAQALVSKLGFTAVNEAQDWMLDF